MDKREQEAWSSPIRSADSIEKETEPMNVPSRRDFSFPLFFLVFWLTVIATVLMTWQMSIWN